MGRLTISPNQKMFHFSHPHELQLCINIQNQPTLISIPCSACKFPPSNPMYICKDCKFNLHFTCAQFPEFITHPSHPTHPLTLIPISTYPGGVFNCDACDSRGDGFSYHCGSCEYDLHVTCAAKPLVITNQYHPCPLELTFLKNPYQNIKGFSCDICRKIGCKQWLYRCSECEFDVHLDCTIASPAPAPILTPGLLRAHLAEQILDHQRAFPHPTLHNPIGLDQVEEVIRPNQYMGSTNSAAGKTLGNFRPNNLVNHPNRTNDDGFNIAAIQDVVAGASAPQVAGQSFMPSFHRYSSSRSAAAGDCVGEDGSSVFGNIIGGPSCSKNY